MNLFDDTGSDALEEAGKVYGVVVGVVSNIDDDEKLGRVKVDLPWREEEGGDETPWARIATLMAGNNRGSWFLPEVGDEVLVAFENGEIEHPFIIGALWNGKDKPPGDTGGGKNNIRKITSRSGHEIVLNDDAEGKKEKVEIKTKAGHKIVLDDSSGGEKIEISDKTGKNKLVMDSTANAVSIESGMEIKLKSTKIAVEASGALDLKTDGILTLKGSLVKIN